LDCPNFTEMKDSDLNLLTQKCIDQLRAGTDVEANKALLTVLGDEKRFRTAKLMNKQSSRWAIMAILAVIVVGLLQAAAIFWLGYNQPVDDDNSCDGPPEYSASNGAFTTQI
jgi:hypothetical protein